MNMCICAMYIPGTHGGCKGMLGLLGLEWSAIWLWELNSHPLQEQQALFITKPFFQPIFVLCVCGGVSQFLDSVTLSEPHICSHSSALVPRGLEAEPLCLTLILVSNITDDSVKGLIFYLAAVRDLNPGLQARRVFLTELHSDWSSIISCFDHFFLLLFLQSK